MNNALSTEDRIWAVISHLSAIAFGMGILLPIIWWSEQRRKSNYTSFQCLQALGYQSLGYTVWFLIYLLVAFVLVIIMFLALSLVAEENVTFDKIMLGWMSFLIVFMLGMLAIYLLLPVIAAVSCAFGRDFRYPILGKRLAHYLGYDSVGSSEEQAWLIEDHEDRWVAAMGHFSILIMLWGMLAPLTAWLLQGKRSLFLKFQSVQTLVYQAGVFFVFLGAGFIAMAGMVIFPVTMWASSSHDPNAPIGMIGIVFLLLIMLIALAIILLIPLFHVLGQYAGYRVLKGDDYHYPLVGRLVEQWMSKQVNSGEENLA